MNTQSQRAGSSFGATASEIIEYKEMLDRQLTPERKRTLAAKPPRPIRKN